MQNQTSGPSIEDLPRLQEDDTFSFQCGPDLECFNRCCTDLDLVLSPYDVSRLCRSLDLSSREFLDRYTLVARDENTGLPEVSLKMDDDADRRCPLVNQYGCTVYSDRPSACRMYPIGRGACINAAGNVQHQYVLVKEEHCLGFRAKASWTAQSWQQDQCLEEYNRINDLYLRFTTRWRQQSRVLEPDRFAVAILALYRMDAFRQYLQSHNLLEQLGIAESKKEQILSRDTECLAFAIRWLESAAH